MRTAAQHTRPRPRPRIVPGSVNRAMYDVLSGDDFSHLKGKRKERKAEKKAAKRAHKIEKKQSKGRYLRSMGKRDERQAKGQATVMLAEQGIVSPHLAEASGKEKFMRGLTNSLTAVMGGNAGNVENIEAAQDYAVPAPDFSYSDEPRPVYEPPPPPPAPLIEDPAGYTETGDADELDAMRRLQANNANPAAPPAGAADSLTAKNDFMSKLLENKKYLYIGAAVVAAVVVYFLIKKKK